MRARRVIRWGCNFTCTISAPFRRLKQKNCLRYTFLILVLLVTSCKKERLFYPIHSLVKMKFHGHVMAIKESTFSNSTDDTLPTKIEWYKFDQSGNKIEFVITYSSYCPDSPDHYYRAYYQYDSGNRLIYSHFTEGGSSRGYSNYFYDRQNRLIGKCDICANHLPYRITHTYSYDTGRYTEVYEHAEVGYHQQFEYLYDSINNLVLLRMGFGEDHRSFFESQVEATYDREGNIIREKGWDDIGEKENCADFTYEYSDRDTAGNWLKKTVQSFGKFKAVVKREIEYY